MFNRMQYYVLSRFITPFVVGSVFFVCFLVIFYAFRLVGIMISRDVQIIDSLKMLMYLAVGFFPTVFPLSTYFGINYSMSKLSEDSEFVAMRSFGMSKFKILLPVLIFTTVLSILVFVMNMNLIPNYQKLFKNTMLKMTAKGVLTDIQPGQFFNDIPGNILYAKDVDQKTRQMKKLLLWSEENDQFKVITAEKGILLKEFIDKSHTPSLRLHLNNGNILIKNKLNKDYQKILFKEYDFPLLKGGGQVGKASKEQFKTNTELLHYINSKTMSLNNSKNISIKKSITKEIWLAKIAYWGRFVGSLQILLFTLLGFSLGITNSRSQSSKGGLLSFLFLVLYYLVYFTGVGLIKKGIVSAEIGSFMVVPIFLFIGIYQYKKIDWKV